MAPGVAAAPANEDNGPPRLHLFGQRLTAKALADLSGGGEGLGWFFNEDELMCPDDNVEHGTISEVRGSHPFCKRFSVCEHCITLRPLLK